MHMAERLADGVWLLDVGLVPPLNTNAFLVEDGEVTLIDAGLWVNRPSLCSELADAGHAPGDVDRVLLTHYDLDHTSGLRELRPAFDGPVYIGRADYNLYTGAADPTWGHPKGVFHRIARLLFPLPGDADVRPVTDCDRIGSFLAYHTPGHNPGHTAYVHDSGAAFVGDLVWLKSGALTVPFWFDSYDLDLVRRSIRRFADRVDPFDVLATGHGRPATIGGYELLRAYAETLSSNSPSLRSGSFDE